MKQRPLTEILDALDKLAVDRGWIVDNIVRFHAGHLLLSPASFANYASSIVNLEGRQRELERELAHWVLAHKELCLVLDSSVDIVSDLSRMYHEAFAKVSDEYKKADWVLAMPDAATVAKNRVNMLNAAEQFQAEVKKRIEALRTDGSNTALVTPAPDQVVYDTNDFYSELKATKPERDEL